MRRVYRLLFVCLCLLLFAAVADAARFGHGGGSSGGGPSSPNIYFATNGNDSTGDGSIGNPYRNPPRAQTAARAVIASGGCPVVIGRDGTYFLSSALALTSADSGISSGCPATWQSYPGEVATFDGGIVLTGWTLCVTADAVCNSGANGVYQSATLLPTYPREFYFGASYATMTHRTRAVAGTYPSGWAADTSSGVLTGPSSGTYAPIASWGNKTDIEFVFRGGWFEPRCKLATASGTPATITMAANCTSFMTADGWSWIQFNPVPTTPYQVENAYELLPACGEGCWYYDRTAQIMYYHPNPGEDMTTGSAAVPSLTQLITATNVSHLLLSRLAIAHQSYNWVDTDGGFSTDGQGVPLVCAPTCTTGPPMPGAVFVTGTSTDVTASHMLFTQNAARSLWFDGGVTNSSVYANDFEENAGGDLMVGGITTIGNNVTIKDNKFNGQQFEYHDVTAAMTASLTNSGFDHDWVPEAPVYGFQFGGYNDGTSATNNNNTLTNSLIENYCNEVPFSDCGSIHTNTAGLWTVTGNYASGVPPGSQGCFYPDSPYPSGPQTWQNNVCDGNAQRAVYLQGANGQVVSITFSAPWYSTNSTVSDGGIGDSVATPVAISAGCGSNSPCLAIKNNAGIESGVTPGPYPPVVAAPVVTSPTTASGTVGVPFSYRITGTNSPTSYSVTGSLPGGLSLDTASGFITGTPGVAGAFSVTIGAINGVGTGTGPLTITIATGTLTPVITSPGTASGTVGVPFGYQITATNSPTGYSAAPLPSWASGSGVTGFFGGTPTTAEVDNLTIGATNAQGTGTLPLTITITGGGGGVPVITSPTTAVGTVGVPFSYQIAATNSPTIYGASPLPSWATGNASTGVISGTPTGAEVDSLTIAAANGSGTGDGPLTITITSSGGGDPVINSATAASGTVGVPFSYNITATNSPTSFNATSLPSWASVNTSTGAITGTPDAAATTNATVTATNGSGTGSGPLAITITGGGGSPPVVTSSGSAVGTVGNFFVYQITGTNSPASYSASSLPGGLSVNTTDGIISGTPTGSGTSTPTIGATNGAGTGNATPTFTIAAAGASGPLTVAANSRYFATPNGQAVYLTGIHTWTSGQWFAALGTFSFSAYADYLASLNENFIRHWNVWDETVDGPWHNNIGAITSPLPFNRTGICCAYGGLNKWDVSSFNQSYFDKLKADVEYAASKGMYISVLLFFDTDYFGSSGYPQWATSYWNGVNNVNSTTTDPMIISEGTDSTTLALQKAYVHKILDTLATEPNVLYEVANEPFDLSGIVSWEEGMVSEVHSYETAHSYMHHLVGIEYYPAYLGGSADFVYPLIWQGSVPVYSLGKPVFADTDHYFAIGGPPDWWWNAFMSGANMLSMDDMQDTGLTGNLDIGLVPGGSPYDLNNVLADRQAVADTRALTTMVDMSGMVPNGSLSSTGGALADTAKHMYLVYGSGTITVNLSSDSGIALRSRWLRTTDGAISSINNITGGSSGQSFTSPYGGTPAVLIVTP